MFLQLYRDIRYSLDVRYELDLAITKLCWLTSYVSAGYILGVNPFDQPGVEAYKKNMFALLGKPGFEARKAELEARL